MSFTDAELATAAKVARRLLGQRRPVTLDDLNTWTIIALRPALDEMFKADPLLDYLKRRG